MGLSAQHLLVLALVERAVAFTAGDDRAVLVLPLVVDGLDGHKALRFWCWL